MTAVSSFIIVISFYIFSVDAVNCPAFAGLGDARTKDTSLGQVNFVNGATCRIKETTLNPTPIAGTFTFVPKDTNPTVEPGDGQTTLTTSYSVTGLASGDHSYHVHNLGDLFSPDGASVENHFVGTNTVNPGKEVGELGGGAPIPNSDGTASTASVDDHNADLTGRNSILGRAIIIHGIGTEDPLVRAAQCVIGWTGESTQATYLDTNRVDRATCALEPANSGVGADLNGEVTFELNEWGTMDVKVFASGVPQNTGYSLVVMPKGDVSQPNGGAMGSSPGSTTPFVGNVGTPVGSRVYVGQVGVGSSAFTFNVGANEIARAFVVDNEIDLNGENSVIGRGLLLKVGSTVVAQCVIGIARDDTIVDPEGPAVDFTLSVPMVIEAQALMLPVTGFTAGFVQFKRLPTKDPLFPGVRVRYHLVLSGAGPYQNHTLQIRTRGNIGAAPAANFAANPIFAGHYSGRAFVDQVGLINDGVELNVDQYGVMNGEFVDRSLWLNDYNSIIGRSVALMQHGSTDNIMAVGVIGHYVDSTSNRDYPSNVVTGAECVLYSTATGASQGVITLTQTAGTGATTLNVAGVTGTFTTANAWGVAPKGDTFGVTSAGYLFSDPQKKHTVPTCTDVYDTVTPTKTNFQAQLGTLGDYPDTGVTSVAFADVTLNGKDSIIGLTIFISADSSYLKNADGAAAIPAVAQATTAPRVAQCVVGITSEIDVVPTGSGIHILPSVVVPSMYNPGDNTGVFSASSSLSVSAVTFVAISAIVSLLW